MQETPIVAGVVGEGSKKFDKKPPENRLLVSHEAQPVRATHGTCQTCVHIQSRYYAGTLAVDYV